jgi:uncharacterized protein (DUF1778 family)
MVETTIQSTQVSPEAQIDVLERSIVVIPAKDWKAFAAWLAQPPKVIPALKKLARKTPTWK